MLSFSAKWLDEKTTHVYGLPDFSLYKKDKTNDRELVKKLWQMFEEADVVIAHNGDEFDIKKANARFAFHKLQPPAPYMKIDTKKVAKRYFKFESNKLDDLGQHLGVGRKGETGGFELWLGCIKGDEKSWKKMKEYNKQDVILLEKIYLELRPWMTNHPNVNVFDDSATSCPICSSHKLQRRGFSASRTGKRQRLQCTDCGGWSSGVMLPRVKELVR